MIARLLALCCLTAAGCQQQAPSRPLTADSFFRRQTVSADTVTHPLDKPGAVMYDSVNVPMLPQDDAPAPDTVRDVPAVVRDNVQAVGPVPRAGAGASTAPTTVPSAGRAAAPPASPPATGTATRAAGDAANGAGGFQVVGFVVAEVNGQPVYADEVIKQLDANLAAEARKHDRDRFRAVAGTAIGKQVDVLIMNEVTIAAAESQLNLDEKQLARRLTTQWWQEQITMAGGSVEMARTRAKDAGLDFDAQTRERYRLHLTQVFFSKKVFPLIHVGADDIRDYYAKNLSTEFTRRGEAVFRLIKVDPAAHGGRDAAERRARDLRGRAAAEDFAALAGSDANDDASLRAKGGLVGPMPKDSYVLEAVERAIWAAKAGELTDVVSDRGAFYVAKVESVTGGDVQPFDLDVQQKIRTKLRDQQFQRIREQLQRKLIADAVVKGRTEAQLDIAIDMAMQNYDQWVNADE